jgi:precorrin-2/cobalt-factor-2 C20-methyltransferase
MSGTLYGVGVGPGDPELLTLKAARLIEGAALVAYVVSPNGNSMAREIAAAHLSNQRELPMRVPMSKDRAAANTVYDEAAEALRQVLAVGGDVVVLCEGDPLFFGSFIYLHDRLGGEFECQAIPGITAFMAATARACLPLTRQLDRLAVVSSRNPDTEILAALQSYDSVVIMKAGPHREALLELIRRAERTPDTVYLERVGWSDERIVRDISSLEGAGPYFSLFITTRRPA